MKTQLFLFLISILAVSCVKTTPEEGVSFKLAQNRNAKISNISYYLHFQIPKVQADSIRGKVDIEFTLAQKSDVKIDFRINEEMLIGVTREGVNLEYKFVNGHIIIPRKVISVGINCFTIDFIAGDGSLNRNEEFLYTLLVPDRASTVFPCFDQPDLKAVFNLSLDIPAAWTAISNGPMISSNFVSEETIRVTFGSTKPISTYLFAFAAGQFEEVNQTNNGKTYTMYHRETDRAKVERNTSIIFNSHFQALDWLEEYTQIPYPFGKLDFILIPGFQYSGMEHPGAIFYRDSRLLLDEYPSINEKLRQANLIAHEVSHQWFGNLVTMQWFNDVWLKEVFAGFMADMIVNPQFPEVNHELSFLLSHHPRSYSVDRTKGANPIVQPLENMLFAGTLYGDIIYHKSPIMMNQLVYLMGEIPFRNGVREYLTNFQMVNATWDDLVSILNNHTDIDLKSWAEIWTRETGRPVIKSDIKKLIDANFEQINLNLSSAGKVPQMLIEISTILENNVEKKNVQIEKLPLAISINDNEIVNGILINSNGMGYGCFVPDSVSFRWILNNLHFIEKPLTRASIHISFYEMFLEGLIERDLFFDFILKSIKVETEPQLRNYLLENFVTCWWTFTDGSGREKLANKVEGVFWGLLRDDLPIDQKKTVFSTLSSIFVSYESFSRLYTAWIDEEVHGVSLSESDRTKLALELIIRKPEMFEIIAHGEANRIVNPDRLRRFKYLLPAASDKPSERIGFAENLKKIDYRKPEPWASEGIRLLHHPLRSDFSLQFIEPMLNLLPEIQRTGDIFFPKSWLDAMFGGHASREARDIVDKWLNDNPDLSANLKEKVLQSVDMLYRVN